jgi:hypothetical protein
MSSSLVLPERDRRAIPECIELEQDLAILAHYRYSSTQVLVQ